MNETSAYRADQVGSFLRPTVVKDARAERAEGRTTPERLAEIEGRRHPARRSSVQRSVGIDVYSDGEFRRTGFQNDFMESVEGYVSIGRPAVERMWQGPRRRSGRAGVVPGRRRPHTPGAAAHRDADGRFMRANSPGPVQDDPCPARTSFPTLGFQPGLTDRFYANARRPAVGHRRRHQGRAGCAGGRRRALPTDRRSALRLLGGTPSGRNTSATSARSRNRSSTRPLPPTLRASTASSAPA